jgi:hypothetical protein
MGDMIDKDVVLAIINDHVQVGSMVEAIAALTPQPAPALEAALELPEVRALVDAATYVCETQGFAGMTGAKYEDLRAAIATLQTKGAAC